MAEHWNEVNGHDVRWVKGNCPKHPGEMEYDIGFMGSDRSGGCWGCMVDASHEAKAKLEEKSNG